jgi:hypothetical protein
VSAGSESLSSGVKWSYSYDFNNRLTQAQETTDATGATLMQQADCAYDVFGHLVEETVTNTAYTTGSGTTVWKPSRAG